MASETVRVVVMRTTSDGAGRPHGIAAGLGANPQMALAELERNALALARNSASSRDEATASAGTVSGTAPPQPVLPGAQPGASVASGSTIRRPSPWRPSEPISANWVPPSRPSRPETESRAAPPSRPETQSYASQPSPPREWRFDVIDVHLVPAAGGSWLAYGTVAEAGPHREPTSPVPAPYTTPARITSAPGQAPG